MKKKEKKNSREEYEDRKKVTKKTKKEHKRKEQRREERKEKEKKTDWQQREADLGPRPRLLFFFFSLFSSLLLPLVLLLRLLRHLLSVFIFFPTVLLLLLPHLLLVSPCTRRTDRQIQQLILIKRNKHKMKLNCCKLHTCKPFSSYRDCGRGSRLRVAFLAATVLAIHLNHHYVRKQRYLFVEKTIFAISCLKAFSKMFKTSH